MESTTLNEEELLSDQFEKAVDEYGETFGSEEKREALLNFLQNNDCREMISKCVDGDYISNAFVATGFCNHPDLLQTFLDHGVNVDIKNNLGWTALMYASMNDNKEIVQLLLDHNVDTDLKDKYGRTALELAKTQEIKEMLQNHVNTSYVLK